MKRYLYEIDEHWRNSKYGVHVQFIPFMPRVFAEKTAKEMNRNQQRFHGNRHTNFRISKTYITTKDGTPHGWDSWETYRTSWRETHDE